MPEFGAFCPKFPRLGGGGCRPPGSYAYAERWGKTLLSVPVWCPIRGGMNFLYPIHWCTNAAVRVLLRVPRYCHICPLVRDLHWLPVEFRINYKIIILTFKIIHGTAPKYLSELISFKSNSHYGLRSNNQLLLSPPKVKTLVTLGDRAFVAAAPKLWNSLAPSLRDISNYELFKQELKTFLFRQAFWI